MTALTAFMARVRLGQDCAALMLGAAFVFALLAATPAAQAQSDVAKTVHNLTPEGKGSQKETVKTGLCVFCHTPHNSVPSRSLWNKDLPGITYQLYASSTLRASLNQPTGSSRLCLSCHDGFVAMGNLRVPGTADQLKLGPLVGKTVLGTDLSDDHPVSFVYDAALAAKHPGLLDPAGLPKQLPLDSKKEMQCTTCHDAHDNTRGNFMRLDNPAGAMCTACHDPAGWRLSSHAISPATYKGGGKSPWPAGSTATTVAGNACNNCHRTHSAPHAERLLAQTQEPDNCNVCHDGSVAQKNIAVEFDKYSHHPIESAQWTHSPVENPAGMQRHVACEDCHNVHASTPRSAVPPMVSGALQGVSGVTSGGVPVPEATFEFQVCSKCHGFREPSTRSFARVEATRIVSTKIDPSNQSFHPIVTTGRNPRIQGLIAGYSATSIIGCTDCHNNSEWQTATANIPRGPHGSRYSPILERYYQTTDMTIESSSNYALCYKCHDRNTLLRNPAGGFPHATHVVNAHAPCAACHDAHGSRQNQHLINFMTLDVNGATVVQASTTAGKLQYVPAAAGQGGTCYLLCHGSDHNPKTYGALATPLPLKRR